MHAPNKLNGHRTQASYRCGACGKRLDSIKQNGRRREYCDDACRVAAHRHKLNRVFAGWQGSTLKRQRNPKKNIAKTTPFLPVGQYRGSGICGPKRVIDAELGGGWTQVGESWIREIKPPALVTKDSGAKP